MSERPLGQLPRGVRGGSDGFTGGDSALRRALWQPFLYPPTYVPPAGDVILRLSNGRLVAGGVVGDEITSKISGRYGLVVDLNDPTLKLEIGRTRFARVRTSPTTPIDWGDTGFGIGAWPTSANRALMRYIETTEELTLTQFNIRTAAGSLGVGDRFKGLVYANDNTGGYPGTRIGVSDPSTPTIGGGGEILTAPCSIIVPPGGYWIGQVCNGGSGPGTDIDGSGYSPNVAIMLSSGEVNYAAPPATAGLWPGSPGPYDNIPTIWFDGTF